MTELRFAVFGAGFWAPFQLAGWNEVGGARCVALYDQTVAKAEKLAASFSIPAVYGSPEQLLDSEELDFVDIITDVSSHSKFVRMVAERGIPVICQKPMAHSLEDAERLVTACREKRVPFYIHENWRWQEQIRAFKKVLDAGEIGRPFRARIFLVSGYPLFRYEPNLRDLEQFVLADMGTHILDVVRFLFGEADRVYCQTHQVQKGIRGEDVATVMLHMAGGTTVTCYMGFPGHFLEQDVFTQTLMFVEGEQGSVELDRDYWVRVTTGSGTRSNRHAPVWQPWMNPQYLASQASISSCIRNLLAGLRGEAEPETTADDNLKTIRLTFAAYESARCKPVIDLSRFTKMAEHVFRS
jgi:D-apiose dehydrogenase